MHPALHPDCLLEDGWGREPQSCSFSAVRPSRGQVSSLGTVPSRGDQRHCSCGAMITTGVIPGQRFSNLSMLQHHQEALLRGLPGPHEFLTRLAWRAARRVCISNSFPGDTDSAGSGPRLEAGADRCETVLGGFLHFHLEVSPPTSFLHLGHRQFPGAAPLGYWTQLFVPVQWHLRVSLQELSPGQNSAGPRLCLILVLRFHVLMLS